MTDPTPMPRWNAGPVLGLAFVVLVGALVLGLMVKALLLLAVLAGLGILLLGLGVVVRGRRAA